jgi:hypothetical protein
MTTQTYKRTHTFVCQPIKRAVTYDTYLLLVLLLTQTQRVVFLLLQTTHK